MDTFKAAVESCRDRPDELYAKAFLYFQAIFRPTESDVSKIQLVSYLPQEVYRDRAALGSVVTAAVIAMFDHRVKNTGDWSKVSLAEIPVYVAIMPPQFVERLDEIILEQAKRVGAGLFASDIVMIRVLEWERHDYRKTTRWLRALDKAARVHQRMTSAPLNDPNLREVKQRALEELRPAIARLQKKFRAKRDQPTRDEIVNAFAVEASDPDLPFLSEAHNLSLWAAFCRSDPYSFLTLSAENLFDAFVGWVSKHDAVYAGKMISSRK